MTRQTTRSAVLRTLLIRASNCGSTLIVTALLLGPVVGAYSSATSSTVRRTQEGNQTLRETNSENDNLGAALKAIDAAERLRAHWTAEAAHQAIEKYREAGLHWRRAGDQRGEAAALRSTGEIYYHLGERQTALTYYRQAFGLSHSVGDREGEADAQNSIGYVCVYSGEYKQALEACEHALVLSRAAVYRQGEAQALNNIGEVYYSTSEEPKALSYFEQALALWRAVGDGRGQAQTLSNIGYTHGDLGELQKASEYHSQALSLWRAAGDIRGEAQMLSALGVLSSMLGEKQQALDYHNQALPLFQRMGDRNGEARTLNGVGEVYLDIGEMERALDCYSRALQLSRKMGDHGVESIALGRIGKTYILLGETRRALDYYNQWLSLNRSTNNFRLEAYALKAIGDTYVSSSDEGKALEYYNRALMLSRKVQDRRGESYTLNAIGYVYDKLGEKQKALSYYNEALLLSRAVMDRSGESLTLHNIARAERDRGHLREACSRIEAALLIAESLRTKVTSQDLRASYFASVRQSYELYIDLLMRLHQQHPAEGYAAAAFQVSERARARSLLELLAEASANIRQGVAPDLLERERSLQQLINAKAEVQMRLLNGKHPPEQAAAMAREIRSLSIDYEKVQTQIRQRSPHYASLIYPQPSSLKEIQQLLDSDTLLLQYAFGDEKSYMWAVTPVSITSYELPKRNDIESEAQRVYGSLTARNLRTPNETTETRQVRVRQADADYLDAAARLSRTVLAPVATQIKLAKRLLVVSDGALQYISFAALPEPDTTEAGAVPPLVARHEIISLPSASVAALLRSELARRASPSRTVAVIADPVFDKSDRRVVELAMKQEHTGRTGAGVAAASASKRSVGTDAVPFGVHAERALHESGLRGSNGSMPRLPFSGREAEAIMTVAPPEASMKALDFAANRRAVMDGELGRYAIVHFATHAIFNNDHPELSGIVLSLVDQQGQSVNGFIRLHEVYNLRLPVNLVVLSACQTALGRDVKGEGMIGLTRGFMYAGAARVVASLWKVDDAATAELMRLFYRGMLRDGLSAAAALQQAQAEMSQGRRWQSPYYWAGFVLQGEWT